MRRLVIIVLLALLSPAATAAPRSAVHVLVRGSKNVAAVIERLGGEMEARAHGAPCLLVVLVDPDPLATRAVAAAAGALAALRARLPEGSVVLVTAVGENPPPLDAPPEPGPAARQLASAPQPGARDLLGGVRRVVRACGGWSGPKDLLLVAAVGTEGEEETEETLDALRRSGFRFSAVAGEASFSAPWSPAPARPASFLVRQTGHPDGRRDTVYPACESPYPDAPMSLWDLALAPVVFRLDPEHKYVAWYRLPSGFGYYHLSRLCAQTGGRYFLFGFAGGGGVRLTYDYGLMNLFEPDLRDRATVLRELARSPLARTVYGIWDRLAAPDTGVIRYRPPVAASGGRVLAQEEELTVPNRPLKLSFWSEGETVWVVDTLRQRLAAVEDSLFALDAAVEAYWRDTGGVVRAGDHRWMAEADLLRLQLLRVRFHTGELIASLLDVGAADFRNESISLLPRTIYLGSVPVPGLTLPAELRQQLWLHEVVGETERMEDTYAGTPWGYAARCGELFTWDIATYPKGESRPVVRARSTGRKDGTKPDKAAAPKPAPRPASGGGGTATGGD